jgi:hypothetical protein
MLALDVISSATHEVMTHHTMCEQIARYGEEDDKNHRNEPELSSPGPFTGFEILLRIHGFSCHVIASWLCSCAGKYTPQSVVTVSTVMIYAKA